MLEIIPKKLRRAHEDGQVVFFCGAGVSMPAGLPSFYGLVKKVLTDLLPSKNRCDKGAAPFMAWQAFEDERLDEALDILESPREGGHDRNSVRERVRYHLTGVRTRTLDRHVVVARLAGIDTPGGRLITTNFDHLFERAVNKIRKSSNNTSHKLHINIAPSLPPARPDTSHGLTYLHGRLRSSASDSGLVLTTADFGTAYLLEGWARRFVIELFRRFHVVFIGYRVEDPTMRYLVSAMAAARESASRDEPNPDLNQHFKEAFAFAPFNGANGDVAGKQDAEQEWRLKGLTPIAYDSSDNHDQLWRQLEYWANDHRQGILGRQQTVAQIGRFPPTDDRDPRINELIWALRDETVARFFANLSDTETPDAGWIPELDRAGMFNLPIGRTDDHRPISVPLSSRSIGVGPELNETTFQLARWLSKKLRDKRTLNWAIQKGGVLHWALRRQIKFQLERGPTDIEPALRKIWQLLSDDNYAHSLSAKQPEAYPTHPKLSAENLLAIRIFLDRLRPIPVFSQLMPLYSPNQEPDPTRPNTWCRIEIELVGIDETYQLDRFRERAKDWEGALAAMAEQLTSRLEEALDWMSEFGLASSASDSTYLNFRSISPHDQNEHAPVWTCLIVLARDSYDALLASDRLDEASLLARRWRQIRYPVFRRLALYAATGGKNA